MRNLLAALCLLCAVGISMCSCSDQELQPPSKAAVKDMPYLVDGKYDEYISEMVSCDSASAAYKQNMKVMLKQMVVSKFQGEGAVKEIHYVRQQGGNDEQAVMVFLQLTYANGSTESMMLPLLWADGRWRLR